MALLLVLAILVGTLWLAGTRTSWGQSLVGKDLRQALPNNITRARLALQSGWELGLSPKIPLDL